MQSESIRVLLVDDEQELIGALAERLTLRGIYARTASSGEQVFACVESEPFDAILLDVNMPGLDLAQLMAGIRRREPQLKIILCSGARTIDKSKAWIEREALDYLVKPIRIETLIQKLREASPGRRGAS